MSGLLQFRHVSDALRTQIAKYSTQSTSELMDELQRRTVPLAGYELIGELGNFLAYSFSQSNAKEIASRFGNESLRVNMYFYHVHRKLCKKDGFCEELMMYDGEDTTGLIVAIYDYLLSTYWSRSFPLREPGLLTAFLIVRIGVREFCKCDARTR